MGEERENLAQVFGGKEFNSIVFYRQLKRTRAGPVQTSRNHASIGVTVYRSQFHRA